MVGLASTHERRVMRLERGEDSALPYDDVADMTGQTNDAVVLMERALASRDPLETSPCWVPVGL